MRYGLGTVAAIAAVLLISGPATSAARPEPNAHMTCDGKPVTWHVHRAHALLKRTYRSDFDLPDTSFVPAAQKHKLCVRIGNVRDQIEQYRADRKWDWYTRVNPYTGGGQRWALPYYIVYCESGGGIYPNLYGLLEGWNEWNWGLVQTASAAQAPKLHQDMAAHRGYVMHGGGPWACA